MALRNKFYDWGVFKSYVIPVPSICVGNLSVGGTGKTPHVDLIASWLIAESKNVAILSRGYGRSTKGLLEVTKEHTADSCGDEPLQYKSKFEEKTVVVVSEDRQKGVEYILKKYPQTDVILLDDAFQHRKVKCGINVLITPYATPFSKDFVLPAGNLREFRSGRKRADSIIVSKCPTNLSQDQIDILANSLKFDTGRIFFSSINYDSVVSLKNENFDSFDKALVVTGIGNPKPFVHRVAQSKEVAHLNFGDHHAFNSGDIKQIHQKIDTFANGHCAVITTEKDYMRLKNEKLKAFSHGTWFYWPIRINMREEEKLKHYILDYVG
jgi:tetraacyldisaccharide 4'-kinase